MPTDISIHVDTDTVEIVVRDEDGEHVTNLRVKRHERDVYRDVSVYVMDPAVRILRHSHGNTVEV